MRKTIIVNRTINGIAQMMAKALKPAWMNWNMASKNRRKSKDTLPPCSCVYVFITLFAIYNECWFSVAVKPNCDIRYTKLLNLV